MLMQSPGRSCTTIDIVFRFAVFECTEFTNFRSENMLHKKLTPSRHTRRELPIQVEAAVFSLQRSTVRSLARFLPHAQVVKISAI